MSVLSSLWNWLDHLLAPSLCPACRQNLAPDGSLCRACQQNLPTLPERRCRFCGGPNDSLLDICPECANLPQRPWFQGVSAFPYTGSLRLAVHNYKFRGQTCLAPFLSRAMQEAWRQYGQLSRPDVVTAVPLHWTRALQRGYNQAEILAQMLAKHLNLPYRRLLQRSRSTGQQARLSRKQRLVNLKGAFRLKDRQACEGHSVLLVDDVFTTGSTLAAASQVLLDGGAKEISVITIARD